MEYQSQVTGYNQNEGSNLARFERNVGNVGSTAVNVLRGVGTGAENVVGGVGAIAGLIGHEVENVGAYVGRELDGAYHTIQDYTTPRNEPGYTGDSVINPTRNESGIRNFAKNTYDDIREFGWNDFYASDPYSTTLRHSMQNPSILKPTFNVIPADTSVPVIPHDTKIFDWNSLIFVIVLLIIFALWKYWNSRK